MHNEERTQGFALIAGFIALIITMAFHPTGRDVLQPGGAAEHAILVNIAVHALALFAVPVIFFGAMGISQRLRNQTTSSTLALIAFGFGSVAGMCAGIASGLIAPRLAERILSSTTPADGALWRALFSYNGFVNQGFAIVYVIASGVAVLLWSTAIVRSRAMPSGLGIYGCISAVLVVLAVGSGHLRLHVHGFGMVVILQAIFFIIAGVQLTRPATALEQRQ